MEIYNGIALIERDTHISTWVKEHNRLDFDQNVLPFVLPYINEGDVVVDIGANIGAYSKAFIDKAGDNGFIYCFEPSKEAYECLKYNIKNENSYLFNVAVGANKGRVRVLSDAENPNNVGMNFCDNVNNGDVELITLDTLKLEQCNFIKMDVEGWELECLIGANYTIEKHKPVLFIEINEKTLKRNSTIPLDIFNWLSKKGYTFRNVYPEQLMKGEQYDIIAIHNESNHKL